jgi:hypothetical protein
MCVMREVGSIAMDGTEYRSIWAKLGWIDPAAFPGSQALALVIRRDDGANETIIRRNARLADVESALAHLRKLGLGDSQMSQLFAHKGKNLAQHVKELVSRLR